MKVVCIKSAAGLTIGKIYDVNFTEEEEKAEDNFNLALSRYWYEVLRDDDNCFWYYDKSYFIGIREYRRQKLMKIEEV